MSFRIICLIFLGFVSSSPLPSTISGTNDALDYLSRYGYMPNKDGQTASLTSKESFQEAVREFQKFTKQEITGELKDATLAIMNKPRCGVEDNNSPASVGRNYSFPKYSLPGGKWETRLSYRISKYSRKLKKSITDEEIRRAFREWSKVAALSFSEEKYGKQSHSYIKKGLSDKIVFREKQL